MNTRGSIMRPCRKIIYTTRAHAKAELRRGAKRNMGAKHECYHCDACEGWHLGTKRSILKHPKPVNGYGHE